jgi:hypothetical protein
LVGGLRSGLRRRRAPDIVLHLVVASQALLRVGEFRAELDVAGQLVEQVLTRRLMLLSLRRARDRRQGDAEKKGISKNHRKPCCAGEAGP